MVDCRKCKFCHIGAYNSGKWYCTNPAVSVFDCPMDTNKCFVPREQQKNSRAKKSRSAGREKEGKVKAGGEINE